MTHNSQKIRIIPVIVSLLCFSINTSTFSANQYPNEHGTNTNKARQLIGHWTFNEGTGNQILDQSGNGNHGTIYGATWVDGISGSALQLDGIDDSIVISHDGSLSGMQNLTVELWIRLTEEISREHINVFNLWGPGSWEDDAYALGFLNMDPHWTASISGTSTGTDDLNNFSTIAISDLGSWYHLALVYSGDSLKLYTNGQECFADKSMGEPIKHLTRNLCIGSFISGTEYKGDIDEMAIYNSALSASEIHSHYLSFIGPQPELIAVPSPTNNRKPVFKWYVLTGTSSYTIQVDTTKAFTSPMLSLGISDTIFTPLADLPIATIYWRIGAGQPVVYSDIGSFVIQDTLTPMLIHYTPNPTLEKRPILKWHSVNGALSYHLMADNDMDFSSAVISLSLGDTSFTPLSDLPIGIIYWKVKSDLLDEYSAISSFLIQSDSVPYLYAFGGVEISNKRPEFKWKPVTGATSYKIEIDTGSNFSSSIVSIELTDTMFIPLTDLKEKKHYWHVSCSKNLALFSPTDSVRINYSVEIEIQDLKSALTTLMVFPNPFKGNVMINFGKPLTSRDLILIYTLDGKLVKQLSLGSSVGKTHITWDGRNRNEEKVGNGVYILKLISKDKTLTKRLISIQ